MHKLVYPVGAYTMPLETVSVKQEAVDWCVRIEPGAVCVKQQPEGEVSDLSDVARLYAGHEIKDELVLGPEEWHRPKVVLSGVSLDDPKDPRRVGLCTYKLRPTCASAGTRYQCHDCGKGFRTKSTLRNHMLMHFTDLSVKPGPAKARKGMKHTKQKRFPCSHCDYKAAQKVNLQVHMRTHTGEKPYQCVECDYRFLDQSSLRRHERRKHTGLRPFQCSDCDYRCSEKSYLKIHARIHTGEKPYKCGSCKTRFSNKPSLRSHELIHTGLKPFHCNHCEYTTNKKPTLAVHLRTHTGEKPYQCSYCDYKCRQRGHLRYHHQMHQRKIAKITVTTATTKPSAVDLGPTGEQVG